MDFTLTDGQKKLVSAFRTFGADTFTPERVAKWCRDQGLPDTVMKEFVDLYYETAEPDIAPDLAHSLLSQVLIVEELSRCAGTTLPFQNDLFNLQIMSGFAGAAEAASIAEDYRADGRLMFALAISEPDGGSDTMAMKTSCQTVDGRLLLNGRKSYVNNGEYAPYILVAAIDKDAGDTGRYPSLSFWLVPRNVPGINAVPISKIGQSMLPFALISFDDVELSPEWRLDASEGGFQQLFHLLEYGRVLLCASSLGMAQAAMDDAVANGVDLLDIVDALALAGGHLLHDLSKSLGVGGEDRGSGSLVAVSFMGDHAALHADALAQALAQHLLTVHIDELIFQGRRTTVDNQNFHLLVSSRYVFVHPREGRILQIPRIII